jgi:hypothetical protein
MISHYGFSEPIKLEPAIVPTGFTVAFNPSMVTLPANGVAESALTVTADASVTPGSHDITVRSIVGAHFFHDATFTVTVVTSLPLVTQTFRTFTSDGCIDNAGVANSFMAKLGAAQRQLDGGSVRASNTTLLALVNEVRAQDGLHILTQCTVAGHLVDNPAGILISGVQSLLAQ